VKGELAVQQSTGQNTAAVRDPKDEICRMNTKAENDA
jgi:hypothetical protein